MLASTSLAKAVVNTVPGRTDNPMAMAFGQCGGLASSESTMHCRVTAQVHHVVVA